MLTSRFGRNSLKWFLLALAAVAYLIPASSQPHPVQGTAIIAPSHDVTVPAAVRSLFPQAADFEAFQRLANQDSVVVYDTVRHESGTANFMDNHPHVAVLRNGNVLLNIDSVNLAPFGPVQFHGLAVSSLPDKTSMMAFAFTLAVDGSGTMFVFVRGTAGGYKVVGTLSGPQTQVRFRNNFSARFELWTADGEASRDECVWCPKFYRKTLYQWRNGHLRKIGVYGDKRAYRPETFTDAPFMPSS